MIIRKCKLRRLLFVSAAAIWLAAGPAKAELTFNFNETSPPDPPGPATPFTCDPMDQAVLDAFVEAGDLWSDIFVDDVTVNIDIGFCDFSTDNVAVNDLAIALASPAVQPPSTT